MAESDARYELPFDTSEEPPALDEGASPEERANAAAHAHYYLCRQLLDTMTTSAYCARLAGVDNDTLRATELQAMADAEAELELEEEESAEVVEDPEK